MKVRRGNIFEVAKDLDLIVIPTNIGWGREGNAIMGAGLAAAAAEEDPMLPFWYGEICRKYREKTPIVSQGRFILVPTKPFRPDAPWLSWMAASNMAIVEKSLKALTKFKRPDTRCNILVPLLGCGERTGKLDPAKVKPLIMRILGKKPYFRLVLPE